MRIHIKAALLSGLVLPGLGQLSKGAKLKGALMLILVNLFLLSALFLVLRSIGEISTAAGGVTTLDPALVLDRIKNHTPFARSLLGAFCALWLYGVIDAAISSK